MANPPSMMSDVVIGPSRGRSGDPGAVVDRGGPGAADGGASSTPASGAVQSTA
jgi:hypothetical protein